MSTVLFPAAARDLLENTLLDAMSAELRDRHWSDVTMARVASGAGVSRQTLYKTFGSRPGFLQAYVLREVERFVADIEQALAERRDDPVAAVAAAFAVFLDAAAENELVRAIVSGEDEELLPLVTTQGQPVLALAVGRLEEAVRREWPSVSHEAGRELSETVVRLAISHAALPTASPAETADGVARLLGPFIERALAE